DERSRPAASSRDGTSIETHVQHRTDSPFEIGRTGGHRRRRQPRLPTTSKTAGQLQQFRGIHVAGDTETHRRVVAGAFTFMPKPGAGDPEEWIEPVDGLADFGNGLDEPVATHDVRELVREHDVDTLP